MKDFNQQMQRSAAQLKEIRESAGLTQKEFSEVFEVNKTTYCRYESGDIKKMPHSLIEKISTKYNINPAWILGYENIEKYILPEKIRSSIKRLPVLGHIAAGIPILAQMEIAIAIMCGRWIKSKHR